MSFENTSYTYWYSNKTLSANNGAADQTLGASALAAANKVILSPPAAYPAGGSGYPKSGQVNGIPGWQGFQKATGIDVAGAIVGQLVARVKSRRTLAPTGRALAQEME